MQALISDAAGFKLLDPVNANWCWFIIVFLSSLQTTSGQ
jgi:hypothetical protein